MGATGGQRFAPGRTLTDTRSQKAIRSSLELFSGSRATRVTGASPQH